MILKFLFILFWFMILSSAYTCFLVIQIFWNFPLNPVLQIRHGFAWISISVAFPLLRNLFLLSHFLRCYHHHKPLVPGFLQQLSANCTSYIPTSCFSVVAFNLVHYNLLWIVILHLIQTFCLILGDNRFSILKNGQTTYSKVYLFCQSMPCLLLFCYAA